MTGKIIELTSVTQDVAMAAMHGNLGLFVGSGLTKALSNGDAPNWLDLLRQCARSLDITFPEDKELIGCSLPEVASKMIDDLSGDEKATIRELKLAAAKIVAGVEFDDALVLRYASALRSLSPAWVVTTNYDLALERLLPNSECILPGQSIRARLNSVPIFHIHGTCLAPDTMVLTSEDYVRLISSSNYRQARLATLFAESTTLMVGYALGDTNVQTARQLATQYRLESSGAFARDQGRMVSILRDSHASEITAEERADDLVVMRAPEAIDAIEVLGARCSHYTQEFESAGETLNERVAGGTFQADFVADRAFRRRALGLLAAVPSLLQSERLVTEIRAALRIPAEASQSAGAFPEYAKWLKVVLDILELWPISTIPPRVLEVTLESFAQLASSIHPSGEKIAGYGFAAGDIWGARKHQVLQSTGVKQLLVDYAEREDCASLRRLLK